MIELLIQGALAAILLVGMLVVIGVELWRGQPISIPDGLTFAVAAVIGFFFGARSSVGGQRAAAETVRAVREEPATAQQETRT